MAFSRFPARSYLTLLGNWNDTLDEEGNGSVIAILKSFILPVSVDLIPTNPEVYDRDLRNRIGDFTDVIDADNNGSLIAQLKAFITTLKAALVDANIITPFVKNLTAVADYVVEPGALVVRVDTTTGAK